MANTVSKKQKKGKLYLLVGPVGAGKSTYAKRQISNSSGVFLDVDTCMVRLFGADTRPQQNLMAWYFERRERCRNLLWDLTTDILDTGTDVFLELGLVTNTERETFYGKARDEGVELAIYLLDAPREVRRERVVLRNHSNLQFIQIVPIEFFERASDAWQEPTESERTAWGIIEV